MGVEAVFLVGFMGSGKNTVGQELARRLGRQFVDMDAEIEVRERQSIPEIFRTRGERGFRKAETDTLRDFFPRIAGLPCIVALGGGAFAEKTNRELLANWPTVFLDAPIEELWERCQQDGVARPLRKDLQQFTRLYHERLPFYREASLTVGTNKKTLPSICLEIENALHLGAPTKNLEAGESH